MGGLKCPAAGVDVSVLTRCFRLSNWGASGRGGRPGSYAEIKSGSLR